MKKLIPLLLILTVLTSCVTERKRLKICANCPTKIETIVRDSIVRKDSTIRIQGETIYTTITAKCPDGAKPIFTYKNGSGKRGKSINKQLNDSTVVNECIIDSAAVAFSWNETHRTVTTEKVLPSEVNCYDWKDMFVSVVLSIVAVGMFAIWLVWGKRSESNKNE
jgi:hypothetical protein